MMDNFGNYIIKVHTIFSTNKNEQISKPKDGLGQSVYLVFDMQTNQYYDDFSMPFIPKKALFGKPKEYKVYHLSTRTIKDISFAEINFKDKDYEDAIYTLRIPFDYAYKFSPTTIQQKQNLLNMFNFNGRFKVLPEELSESIKQDINNTVRTYVSRYLAKIGRIEIFKHLIDIEKTLKQELTEYFQDKGLLFTQVSIDPSIKEEEERIQQRVTQNVATKKIISKGDN